MLARIFRLPAQVKLLILLSWDIVALFFALLSAYWVRVGLDNWQFGRLEWMTLVATSLFTISLLFFLGHYRQVTCYSGLKVLYIATLAIFTSVVLIRS